MALPSTDAEPQEDALGDELLHPDTLGVALPSTDAEPHEDALGDALPHMDVLSDGDKDATEEAERGADALTGAANGAHRTVFTSNAVPLAHTGAALSGIHCSAGEAALAHQVEYGTTSDGAPPLSDTYSCVALPLDVTSASTLPPEQRARLLPTQANAVGDQVPLLAHIGSDVLVETDDEEAAAAVLPGATAHQAIRDAAARRRWVESITDRAQSEEAEKIWTRAKAEKDLSHIRGVTMLRMIS